MRAEIWDGSLIRRASYCGQWPVDVHRSIPVENQAGQDSVSAGSRSRSPARPQSDFLALMCRA